MTTKPTYYEFFGLKNFEADPMVIKRAYRSMALKHHPDRNTNKVEADRVMKQVNEVYRVLSRDKESYDRHLKRKMGGGSFGEGFGFDPKHYNKGAGGWSKKNPFDSDHLNDAFRYAYGGGFGKAWFEEADFVSEAAWDDIEKKHKARSSHADKKTQEEDLQEQFKRRYWLDQLTNEEWIFVRDALKVYRERKK